MARSYLAHCFALAALGVCTQALQAQDTLLDDLYGRGVHAFFSRNYEDAHKLLSEAITSGSKDPRVYYFRALVDNRLKRPEDATADLKMATELEFGGDDPVNVSKALERIQGSERLTIEAARNKARLDIRTAAEERAKIRYENRVKAEARVLRTPSAAAPSGVVPAAATSDKTDPFDPAAPAPLPEVLPSAKPGEVPGAAPAKPASEDPFGEAPAKPAAPAGGKPATPEGEEKPAAPAKPAVEDPFGDSPAKPAAPAREAPPAGEAKPAGEAAAAPAGSGKGSILGSFRRAFSKAIPGEAKNAAAKPAVEEEAPIPKGDPNAADPFADGPAKPAAPGKAPGAKPAADDPFADDPPAKPSDPPAKPGAKPPAAEDPFK